MKLFQLCFVRKFPQCYRSFPLAKMSTDSGRKVYQVSFNSQTNNTRAQEIRNRAKEPIKGQTDVEYNIVRLLNDNIIERIDFPSKTNVDKHPYKPACSRMIPPYEAQCCLFKLGEQYRELESLKMLALIYKRIIEKNNP